MKLLEAFCCYQKEEAAPPINHRVTAPLSRTRAQSAPKSRIVI
jgi:hypothetical protein